ncbi:MAG: OmpA family protein [Candidatus Aminicenantes bacterium]|nr:OmpA family protein [Candidatus Aminicenantes bacterium]
MKKIFCLFILGLMFMNLTPQEDKKKETQEKEKIPYSLASAHAYNSMSLIIGDTDLVCSYFITSGVSEEIRVIGAQEMDLGRISYSKYDELFINKGAQDGIKEGEKYSLIGKGRNIRHPFTGKKLGYYYVRKFRATVTAVFEKKSVITLGEGCFPAYIGDIVVPFEKGEEIKKQLMPYDRVRLPDSPVVGRVILSNIFMDINRDNSGPECYISIDIGNAFVSIGDYVVFCKYFKNRDLPKLIIGSGVVINAQNTSSTVRILDSSNPVEIGAYVYLLPETGEKRIGADEAVPTVDATGDTGPRPIGEGEDSFEFSVLFDINEKTPDPKYMTELKKIKEFIDPRSRYVVILRGYSCSIGGLEYNLKLSQERVENIKNILVNELNINKDFIETYYYGEKNPPFDNTSEETRRKNRSVNVQVIGKK